jgi:hypothetical protein
MLQFYDYSHIELRKADWRLIVTVSSMFRGARMLENLRLWWAIQMSTTNKNGIDMGLAQNQNAELPQFMANWMVDH